MRVPQEIVCQILREMVEILPFQELFRARLVARIFADEIMTYLLQSARLENDGFGFRNCQKAVVPGWGAFPHHLKLRYLRHKLQQHATAPCIFSNWIHGMLELDEAKDATGTERRDLLIEKLLYAVAGGRYHPAELFCADRVALFMEWYWRQRGYESRIEWEPLSTTFQLLLACSAIKRGDADELDRLLRQGLDSTRYSYRFGLMPLDVAAKRGNGAIVRTLIKHDCPLYYRFQHNWTSVLSVAARSGNKDGLGGWVEDFKSRSWNGMGYRLDRAIQSVARIGNVDMLEFLLNQCDSHQQELRYKALIEAVENGQGVVVDRLLDHGGFDPDFAAGPCPKGPLLTALQCKQETQRLEMVKVLLERGADPNRVYPGASLTPLQKALEMKDIATARLLVDYGANVNAKSLPPSCRYRRKRVPPLLLVAAKLQNGPLIRLLLDRGINPIFAWRGKKYHVQTQEEPIRQVERVLVGLGLDETEVQRSRIDYLLVQIA
ncbi:ankyrin repeat-containing domain protein [Aspergillus lucknowensis]|uniref:Ankyrin repeat-containing domain protein n=1 Tax=Aspergillus lucknowensis TaxID=176173 RepID=A0ABR4LE13_9EURO